jgi:hypothetical protein
MLAVAALKEDGGKVRTASRKFKPIEHSAVLERRGQNVLCSIHD